MSDHHTHSHPAPSSQEPGWRRVLWIALWVNAAMFGIESVAGWLADSMSLLADAIDFAGDAANYGLSLAVLSLASRRQSQAALFKGVCMVAYGILVLAKAAWLLKSGAAPVALTMGVIGTLAMVANVAVAALLYRYREGNANMRSVWLCSRNDALGNLAVVLAAVGVWGSGAAWPDLLVAALMAVLALSAGQAVIRQALQELATPKPGT